MLSHSEFKRWFDWLTDFSWLWLLPIYQKYVTPNLDSRRCLITLGEIINPLPDDKILDWSKLEQIADNNLKCI